MTLCWCFLYSPLLYLFANLFFPPFCKLYRLYIIYSGNWRVVVAPFIIFLGTIGISILQSLNDDQTAYPHQTSHVLDSPNGKRFAQLQLLCKTNHRLHCSVAGVDVRPQRHSDNLDQWTYYLLCSSSFGKRDVITQLSYECCRNFGRICPSFHCPWYIMCCLLWKTTSTRTCFCGCVGLICGKQSF